MLLFQGPHSELHGSGLVTAFTLHLCFNLKSRQGPQTDGILQGILLERFSFYSPLGKAVELDRVLPEVHGLCCG